MIIFIIFYCIFSILVFAGIVTTKTLEEDEEKIGVKHFISFIFGPIMIPLLLGRLLFIKLYDE